jgi:hypothetical protein
LKLCNNGGERVEAAAPSRGRRRLYIVLHENVAVVGRLGPESPARRAGVSALSDYSTGVSGQRQKSPANSGMESEPSNPRPQPRPSHRPESPAPEGRSLRLQQVDPENPAGDKSLRPNSGWTSKPFDPMVSQGRNSRPESPGHRGPSLRPGCCNRSISWRPSTITTFAKHPTKLLSSKPNTGLQTPIFSTFLGVHPRDTGST